jgi:hypothetical protein
MGRFSEVQGVSIAVAQNGHSWTLPRSEAEPQIIDAGTKRLLMH